MSERCVSAGSHERIASSTRRAASSRLGDQTSSLRNAVRIERKRADLPVHLPYRIGRECEIVRKAREALGKRRRDIFEIGQVDIDQPLELAQGVRQFIRVRIVHNRDPQAHGFGRQQRLTDHIQMRRGRHQIDVVRALRLQIEVVCGQHIGRLGRAERSVVERIVLAEHTVQIAPGKEHGAGATRAADARFLPVVQRNSCNAGQFPRVAQTGMRFSVRTAAARTIHTMCHQNTRLAQTKLRVQYEVVHDRFTTFLLLEEASIMVPLPI